MTPVKTDENLSSEAAAHLRAHGVDAASVTEQKMQRFEDEDVWAVCQREHRALVTLDVDFADQRVYPTRSTPGIVAMRLSSQHKTNVRAVLDRLVIPLLRQGDLADRLWIVSDTKVRPR